MISPDQHTSRRSIHSRHRQGASLPSLAALLLLLWLSLPSLCAGSATSREPVRFNKGFEGASLGRIEQVGESAYRLHVEGQQDSRGRNRQATWFYFGMENVRDRDVVLTFTDFVGEYNDRPGACPMGPDLCPTIPARRRCASKAPSSSRR
jgi:hypothetical protein